MKPAQERPPTLEHRAYLALLQAHEALHVQTAEVFKAGGLTETQFNALRILLRGSLQTCSCQEIGDQLLKRVPDVTRLIDRMEKAGLVTRERSAGDRRVVEIRITAEGQRRAEALYQPLQELHEQQFAHFTPDELGQLDRLLRTLFIER